ncbi:lysophospholipid acyltransferase family protein [bacterium]|nr:lysophospholipid acyltransferase family protein [bacterium]MBU1071823.1 lysophospholipid acyltransferase family protein [bacterium]MBU1675801.1 lysophospholipid acyltransferase family protein [bacterium]
MPKKILWALEYALLCLVFALASILPESWLEKLGGALGRFVFRHVGARRQVVLDNLAHAFPDRDVLSLWDLAERIYANLGVNLFAFFALARLTPARIRARVRLENTGYLDGLRAAGEGALLMTGHFGHWELLGAAVSAYGYPTRYLVRTQSNPWADRLQNKIRARAGLGVIRADASVRQLVRHVRSGGFVGVLPDANAGDDGIFVDFLGRPASTPRGLAYFAYKLGCPIIPVFLVRQADGTHVARFHDPLRMDPAWDEQEAVLELTKSFTDVLSGVVREHPDHYFWIHRRWKTRPPAERSAAAAVGTGQDQELDRELTS